MLIYPFIFKSVDILGVQMNKNILFTINKFTRIFKCYAYSFVLEKKIKLLLICNNYKHTKNDHNYDDNWSITIWQSYIIRLFH